MDVPPDQAERSDEAEQAGPSALDALAAGLDDPDLDADARLELLRRVEAGIAAELDGLDGL